METPKIVLTPHLKTKKSNIDFCPDPSQYIVGCSEDYKCFEIKVRYYYQSELDAGLPLAEVVIDDPVNYLLFYGRSDSPLKELSDRLLWFYSLLSDTQKRSLELSNFISDDFNDTLFKKFCNSLDKKILLNVPSDFFKAELYIETLRYKFRKMLDYVLSIYRAYDGALFWHILEITN